MVDNLNMSYLRHNAPSDPLKIGIPSRPSQQGAINSTMYMDLRGLPDGADSPAPAMQIMFLDELNVFLNAAMSFEGI